MKPRITRHNGPAKWPCFRLLDQPPAGRVCQNIEADPGKGILFAFLLAQHVVVCLRLEFMRGQQRLQMRSQEGHPVSLIGVAAQAKPHQMNVVWHQTIDRTHQTFPGGNMQQ